MQVKIAFIGCGRMATVHASALRKFEDVEITGVYDIVPEKGAAFAEKFGAKKIYSSRAELLADKDVAGVAICDYGNQHADELLAVMGAGIRRIFCEKPAVRTFEEGDRVLAAARETGTLVCIGHVRRYFPAQVKMKQIIDSGLLGRILFAKVHECNPGFSREWGNYFASFARSGGTTLDMGTHYMDLFNWFFGRPKSVSARMLGMEKTLSPEEKPCDYFTGNILYENDVICGLETSYQRHGASSDLIEVYGDRNTLLCDRGVVTVRNRESVTEYTIAKEDPHERQMRAFADMILNGTKCRCMLEDGVLASRIALGMVESAESGVFHSFAENI